MAAALVLLRKDAGANPAVDRDPRFAGDLEDLVSAQHLIYRRGRLARSVRISVVLRARRCFAVPSVAPIGRDSCRCVVADMSCLPERDFARIIISATAQEVSPEFVMSLARNSRVTLCKTMQLSGHGIRDATECNVEHNSSLRK